MIDADDDHDTIANATDLTTITVAVEVVIYNADGTSVFRVTDDGS